MNTMDIRIKITDDIIKESDQFSDDSSSQEYKTIEIVNDKLFKSDIVNKAKNFKKKCLARISSLTVRWNFKRIQNFYLYLKINKDSKASIFLVFEESC